MHTKRPPDWKDFLPALFKARTQKPRSKGTTMILDRNLGLVATQDLCEMVGPYIDQIKLSFGTALLLESKILRKKIELIKSFNIEACPGGTLFEIAYAKKATQHYFKGLLDLGFSSVEISDGIIILPPSERAEAIEAALKLGFKVYTEVGKKDPDGQIGSSEMITQILADFSTGVKKVIVEARESGTGVGVFDNKGNVKDDLMSKLTGQLSPDQLSSLIWEAPIKSQQVYFIKKFGMNVNLGNISPQDALGLEALRCGLRWDTFEMQNK